MNSRELYITLDSPVHKPGEIAEVYVMATSSELEVLELEVVDYRGIVAHTSLRLSPGEYAVHSFQFQVPRIPGKYELSLRLNGEVVDRAVHIVVGDYELSKERSLAFVWHNHQAPSYLPDGTYYFPWAFKHVYEDELVPYGKGPYHYHAVVLSKYNEYRCTYNLSPSLLAQWIELLEKGVIYRGVKVEPNSSEALIVKETLELYKAAARREQVDILTSMYAHSIAGYLVEYLGAEDIVKEEVEYGIEITKKSTGVEPRGIWTPEMAFSMKLVDVYSDLGLEYTVLDEKCHFEKSSGEKGSCLEPYLVKGSTGELVVFFRNTELSNHVGFKNNFKSALHAWKSAYEFTYMIVEKLRSGGALTIALDGENWMIFSKKPPLTAVFYDKLVSTLIKLQKEEYLKTTTLRELVEKLSPRRELRSIPTTSWLCGFAKWHSEVKEHGVYWEKIKQAYRMLKEYENAHGADQRSRRARRALWHALDSDYWWAEFWEPRLINAWLEEMKKALST